MLRKKNKEMAEVFAANEKFATDHLMVVEKFGRYPTRNKILSRVSTPEEKRYLKIRK